MSVRVITGGIDSLGRAYVSRRKLRPLCPTCGGEVKRNGTAPKFCSHPCYAAAMKGRPKPPEQVAARNVRKGATHSSWMGDAVSERGGRARALRLFPDIGSCSRCSATRAERHHKDGDTANNAPTNIEALCRRCHMEADGRLAIFRAMARKGRECR